jgi:hypothetical protein
VEALFQNTSVAEAAEYLVSLMERNKRQASLNAATADHTVIPLLFPAEHVISWDSPFVVMPDEQQATSSNTTTVIEEKKPLTELKPLSREELQV